MTPEEIVGVGREALFMAIQVAGPILVVGLIVGLTIGVFQATTQIQEMTLVFVPKIFAIMVAMFLTLPFMMRTLVEFMERLADRIIALG